MLFYIQRRPLMRWSLNRDLREEARQYVETGVPLLVQVEGKQIFKGAVFSFSEKQKWNQGGLGRVGERELGKSWGDSGPGLSRPYCLGFILSWQDIATTEGSSKTYFRKRMAVAAVLRMDSREKKLANQSGDYCNHFQCEQNLGLTRRSCQRYGTNSGKRIY